MSVRRWIVPKLDKEGASLLAEECGLHPFLALLLHSRGIRTTEDVQRFLWDDEEEDPFLFADMDAAAERIQRAVDEGEPMCIFGDYDADGITSTVLLYLYLREQNARVQYYIPRREEGYGLNTAKLDELAAAGVTLVVTVDNGISAIEEAAHAKALGLDLVITDHHQPQETLPDAVAVVDPHRRDCPSAFKDYAGVGVAYKLVCALDGDPAAVLERYGDLVALGTLADVMPLKGENRRLVRQGLRHIADTPRPGVQALLQVAGAAQRQLTATGAVFTIAPRINAAGRMGCPDKAAQLMLAEGAEEAAALADELQAFNVRRQQTETEILAEAQKQLWAHPEKQHDRVLVLAGKGWHPGVIGIIAARLLEHYGKPCLVLSVTEEGVAKGSGRSLPGFSLFEALSACDDELLGFGGHELAAGVTLRAENIDAFSAQINRYAAVHFPQMPLRELTLDCKLRPSQIDLEKLQILSAMEPFGAGNPVPLFGLFSMKLDNITPVGNGRHLRLSVSRDGCRLSAMLFNCTVEELIIPCGSTVDLAVTLDKNEYHGVVSPSIYVKDIRFSDLDQEELIEDERAFERLYRREGDPQTYTAPTREQTAAVYRLIRSAAPFKGTPDQLFHALGGRAGSYTVMLTALEVLGEAGLIRREDFGDRLHIDIMPTDAKADLARTPLMRYLNNGDESE